MKVCALSLPEKAPGGSPGWAEAIRTRRFPGGDVPLDSRRAVPALAKALEHEEILTHPFVIGELACGEFSRSREILTLLSTLPSSTSATDDEARRFIEDRGLMGKGIGYIDVHLLAAVILTEGSRLWTNDKRLDAIAAQLGVDFKAP